MLNQRKHSPSSNIQLYTRILNVYYIPIEMHFYLFTGCLVIGEYKLNWKLVYPMIRSKGGAIGFESAAVVLPRLHVALIYWKNVANCQKCMSRILKKSFND